jgi:hypothetical protein
MSVVEQETALHDAEAPQGALREMVEKIRWLMEHECFPSATLPRWQEVVADAVSRQARQ